MKNFRSELVKFTKQKILLEKFVEKRMDEIYTFIQQLRSLRSCEEVAEWQGDYSLLPREYICSVEMDDSQLLVYIEDGKNIDPRCLPISSFQDGWEKKVKKEYEDIWSAKKADEFELFKSLQKKYEKRKV